MKLKKLSLIIISLLLAVCMALPLIACKDDGSSNNNPDSGTNNPDDEGGNNTPTDPVQLVAPQISLNDNVISWSAVENANYYEVYEGEKVVAKPAATSYTITKTAVGSYTYAVKALSVSEAYTASELSNTVTYTVEPKVEPVVPLAAPAITLKDNQITWSAVEHATAYEIYENGEMVEEVSDTVFDITTVFPGEYVYAIRAVSSDTAHYSPSELSNTVTYTLPAEDVDFVVTVSVPSGYSAAVQVALYKDGETTPVDTKAVSISGTQGSVTFNLTNAFKYTAKVVSVPTNFASTTASLSAAKLQAEIMIISMNASETFNVGTNSFRVANQNQTGADQIYYFLPSKSGMYTLDASLESKDMYISVNRSLYIDTVSGLNIASFRAEDGVPVEITVVGFELGTFRFKIVEGELAQSLRIGIGWGNRANYIFGDCIRTLEVSSPDYYVFEFGFAGLGGRTITLTIGGKDYVFGGYDEETTNVDNWFVIPLNKGTHEVKITTVGFNPGDEFGFSVLCIYQGQELRSVN